MAGINSSTMTIEWLAERNLEEYIQDGERVIACDYQGNEIARGALVHTGGSGWIATIKVGRREFTSWLVFPNRTVWIDTNAGGALVYIYREYKHRLGFYTVVNDWLKQNGYEAESAGVIDTMVLPTNIRQQAEAAENT